MPHHTRSLLSHLVRVLVALCPVALLLGAAPQAPRTAAAAPGWRHLVYAGAVVVGHPAHRVPGYSLDYPPGWRAHQWPDTLAGYGQTQLESPSGTVLDLVLLPLRPHGPGAARLIAHDAAYMSYAVRDRVALPLGTATRVRGAVAGSGRVVQVLYLSRRGIVYRLYAARSVNSAESALVARIAASLRVPPAPGLAASPPAPPQGGVSACCRCPAWGSGWGTVLTRLDGVAVYSNAGDVDNGCTGTYGILYQCVELAQRYFAQRWGYPAIWAGVDAAADMPTHHPAGIRFVPNGGAPGPVKGDALVFYGGPFGHVALVGGVDRRSGRVDLVEENWSATGTVSLPIYADGTVGIRDSAYGSYLVAGWLHSPLN